MSFKDLGEREILALAVSLEEEDGRIYGEFAEGLRKDFPATDWWPKMLTAQGKSRLEELAFLFLRAKRSVPPELQAHASLDRFAKAEEAEQEIKLVQELENWLCYPVQIK